LAVSIMLLNFSVLIIAVSFLLFVSTTSTIYRTR
jgi:hypothetical protein